MIDLATVQHHPAIEEIVDVLCRKTQNIDRGFFRTEVAYFLAKMASSMRAVIVTKDRGEIPVNIYALALATSGFGKGHSVSIMENEFIKGFKDIFMTETMPTLADAHLFDLAKERAQRNVSDENDEYNQLVSEYKRAGKYAFTFDSGTSPAIKQLRHRVLLAGIGSINLQIDEIGSNLIGSNEILTLYLELYDQGQVKQKLTKNTAENERAEELDGKTPTNALLFGTPNKLLDGGQTEEQFYSFLETGYARRCLFGYGQQSSKSFNTQSAAEIYKLLIQPTNHQLVAKWADHFSKLANPAKFGFQILVEDATAIRLLEYKIWCEQRAELLKDHDEIGKAELNHRYFKVLKLAGTYAFIDETSEIDIEQLEQAMKLVEESGEAFKIILNREKTYMKLARYIADINTEVTHADLHEALPFYKSSAGARNEMILMATAWGYKQHIIIKKSFIDGIEFFKGEKLKETNLDEMILSYSDHFAYNYQAEMVPFDQLTTLTQQPGMHWCNHRFKNEHRAEENAVPGFNLLVLDIDGGTTLQAVHDLLAEYKFLTYTTKSHIEDEEDMEDDHCFRLILPMNYILELDSEEYKEFMDNVVSWLPFKLDESANQRSRKWATHDGNFHFNDGTLLNVLPFIPKTAKNEEYKAGFKAVESHDNLERWFAIRMASGNRNNQMLKYALALVDGGVDLIEVGKRVHAFNAKLSNALTETEIDSTIMTTVAKRFQKK